MPMPNEHSCRLKDPSKFKPDSFRRMERESGGKKYSVIMGRLKDEDKMSEQAYRYPKDVWTESQARSHCNEHDGILFEPAKEEKQKSMIIERRFIPQKELRAKKENDKQTIEGYAAIFDSWSEDLGNFPMSSFREIIRAGAFTKTIQESDIRALVNHDPNMILGRNTAGTLELSEDKTGLKFSVAIGDQSYARDIYDSINRGDISGCSFSFDVIKEQWGKEDGKPTRELFEVRLYDLGPVTFPAYPDTNVNVRSLLRASGIDVDVIEKVVMEKRKHITKEEREIICKAIETLQDCITDEEPGPVSHSRVKILRRKLKLLEKINNKA